MHWTNDALRRAFERRAPLVYFRAVESSWYEAIWPVWVEDFAPDAGRVLLAAEDADQRDVSSVQVTRTDEVDSGKVVLQGDKEAPKPPSLVQQSNAGGLRIPLRVQRTGARQTARGRAYQGGRRRRARFGDERDLHVDPAPHGVRRASDRCGSRFAYPRSERSNGGHRRPLAGEPPRTERERGFAYQRIRWPRRIRSTLIGDSLGSRPSRGEAAAWRAEVGD